MRYLGNKESIVLEIYNLLKSKNRLDRNLVFLMLSAVQGLSQIFKEYFDSIIVNDNLKWSVVYAHGRICATKCTFKKLTFDPFEYLNKNAQIEKDLFIKTILQVGQRGCISPLKMQEELIILERKLKSGIPSN